MNRESEKDEKELIKSGADENDIKMQDVNWNEVNRRVFVEAENAWEEKSIYGEG